MSGIKNIGCDGPNHGSVTRVGYLHVSLPNPLALSQRYTTSIILLWLKPDDFIHQGESAHPERVKGQTAHFAELNHLVLARIIFLSAPFAPMAQL